MSDSKDIVQRLRGSEVWGWIGPQAADLIEALEAELSEAKKVFSETFDAARQWKAQAEAAEAEVKRLKSQLSEAGWREEYRRNMNT